MKKERLVGPDILRFLAICLVMCTHLINYNSKYFLQKNIHSLEWTATVFIRYTAILCVPIFLLLTGFLLSSRKPNRKHYTSIITVLFPWLILTAIINVAEWNLFGPTTISIPRALIYFFGFSYGYTWYVEMYLCLFLVIPYINILLDRLSRKAQLRLIAIVGALTLLPAVGKSFLVDEIWLSIFPEQFEDIYCITYYLIGTYIARHKPQPSRILCAVAFFGAVGMEVALVALYSRGEYAWWLFTQYSALPHAIAATALFLIFYRVKKLPRPVNTVVKEISLCSFDMYLISYFTDKVFYSWRSMKIVIPGLEWLTSHSLTITFLCNFLCAYLIAKTFRIFLVPISDAFRRLALEKAKSNTSNVTKL